MAIIHTDGDGRKTLYRYALYHPIYVDGRRVARVFANGGLAYPDEYAHSYWTKIRGVVDESWTVPSDCPLMLDSTSVGMVGEFTLEIATFYPPIFEDVETSYRDMIPRVDARDVEGASSSSPSYYDATNLVSRLVFDGAPTVAHKRVILPFTNNSHLYGRITFRSPAVVPRFGTVKRVLGYSGYYDEYVAENHEYALTKYDGTIAYPRTEGSYIDPAPSRDGKFYSWSSGGYSDWGGDLQQCAHAVCADGRRCVEMSEHPAIYPERGIDDQGFWSNMQAHRLVVPYYKRYVANGHTYGKGVARVQHDLNTRLTDPTPRDDHILSGNTYREFDACLINMRRMADYVDDPRVYHDTYAYDTILAMPVTEVVDSNYDTDEVAAIWDRSGRSMSHMHHVMAELTSVYYEGIPDWGMDVIEESRLTYPTEPIIPL